MQDRSPSEKIEEKVATTAVQLESDMDDADKDSQPELSGSTPPTSKPISAYANLSSKESLRLFWKPTLFCFLAAYGACNDGFQISLMSQLNVSWGAQYSSISVHSTYVMHPG